MNERYMEVKLYKIVIFEWIFNIIIVHYKCKEVNNNGMNYWIKY